MRLSDSRINVSDARVKTAYDKPAIIDLRIELNNSRQLMTDQKVINNDLADMEVAYTKQNIELANLGAKSAIDAIGKFKKLQMDNLESEATNDFYENQYKNYLNSPEVDEASDVLKTSSDSGTLMHSSFNDLYNKEGVPAYVIHTLNLK